jgi:hypothetical protein
LVKIKDVATIAKKFVDVTPGRAPYYEAGVRAPDEDYATRAKEAEPSYETGVTGAISKKLFGKGVAKAGTAKWQAKTLLKGVDQGRFRSGVTAAGPDFESGYSPYQAELARLTLPKRGPRGDPANVNRVEAIRKALYEKRVGGAGAAAAT